MRYFFKQNQFIDNQIILNEYEYHYLSRVKRLKAGDPFEFVIKQTLFIAEVLSFKTNYLKVEILRSNKVDNNEIELVLFQSIIKEQAFSTVLSTCTQLGVSKFIPVITHRSIVKINPNDFEKKRIRWEKILTRSSSQSFQDIESSMGNVLSISDFLKTFTFKNFDILVVPWEEELSNSLQTVLDKYNKNNIKRVGVFIGPEGGLTKNEIDLLKEKEFKSVSLGKHILKSESAGFYTLAQIKYFLNI
ncbi:hypothetical protein DID75_02270 [Candidatus Marinamargulisbacteria bacterium SCGC AG-410-N11]|nr:hypothetical protein DID75_02270 [Candidatus Marinamargulisbacteria bacterium SCGC AG-410-N11]